MSVAAARYRARGWPGGTGPAIGVAALVGVVAIAALGMAAAGPAVVALPVAGVAAFVLVRWPRAAALGLLALGLAVDTAQVDPAKVMPQGLWQLPAGISNRLPLTTSPFELALGFAAVVVLVHPAVRQRRAAQLPGVAWLVPPAIAMGLAYGVSQGGEMNLAYHEARGLLFGIAAFVVTWRLRVTAREALATFLAATAVLGVVSAGRWVLYLNPGRSPVQPEFWFGHETGLFLALGFVVAAVLLLRAKSDRERVLLVAYGLLMAGSMLMTGRRSAILVVLVGVLAAGWLLLPKRPVLLVTLAMVGLLAGAAYLSAYWDENTGPLAQPARAIRSQVDPDARDRSSDEYREIERDNLQRTLQEDPVMGVGFGRPFTQYRELPELWFWELQSYTPHQNILWLWLKTGIAGLSVIIGLWVIAFGRCIRACRSVPRWRDIPAEPAIVGAGLLMYLCYARIDLALVSPRSAVPLACLVALALLLPMERGTGDGDG
ncbi:MAG: O-antigen ligase family protein [Dehalococcoidia bacterium]|nr:O-antigen ligase family protein [Dehalococcoidia bacterium]